MRRRFVQINGELVEVSGDFVPEARTSVPVIGDRHYDGLRASDGADISTRTKHREYMKQHGLTTVDDFRTEFKVAEKKRVETKSGVDPTRRRDIERAIGRIAERR